MTGNLDERRWLSLVQGNSFLWNVVILRTASGGLALRQRRRIVRLRRYKVIDRPQNLMVDSRASKWQQQVSSEIQ
jgi:hypothetical protein